MLVIRLQRTGRSGHAQFRVVVQDSRISPSSGKVVARVGSYDPHAKTLTVDKEKVEFYLKNGARPSDRAARLFKTEKIKLPEWFTPNPSKKSAIKNTDKLRRNRPADAEPPAEKTEDEAPAEEPKAAETEQNTEPTPESSREAVEETSAEPAPDAGEEPVAAETEPETPADPEQKAKA